MKIKYYCIDCGRRIWYNGARCNKCKSKGILNPNYIDGRTHKKKCSKCGKYVSKHSKKYCIKCYIKTFSKGNNPMQNKKQSKSAKNKMRNKALGRKVSLKIRKLLSKLRKGIKTGKQLSRHHINLNKKDERKSNIFILSRAKHTQLHQRAYEYLVYIDKINDYIKWYKEKYY
jgi:DNA-directed RNA polymerase subunit RPC12/RpoP